ncbi:MAG TPA: hypothetical protein VG944_02140 [Fimbriimonas sp.]|nr:hypothetical protein [Fimbriimonas sp.]
MDETFAQDYEVDQLTELPGHPEEAHYYYPGGMVDGGGDGVLVRVRRRQRPIWLGTFAFGKLGSRGVTGIYATPNPRKLCVVGKGAGYFVSVDDPSNWEEVRVEPILDVRGIPSTSLMIFADFTRMIAHGPEGLCWETERLSWDGFEITEVCGSTIEGRCRKPGSDDVVRFGVDLDTGEVRAHP